MATSQTLVADGPTLTLTGQGSLNLGEETIDFVLYPRKKRRFWASADPVKIKGPLTDPSVKALPVGGAGGYGALALAPQIAIPGAALGYLWSLVRKNGDMGPCRELVGQGADLGSAQSK